MAESIPCVSNPLQDLSLLEKQNKIMVFKLFPGLFSRFKGSVVLKSIHFIIQKGFNKLIYGINTIIKCGTILPTII